MSSTRGKTAQNPLTPTVLNQMLKKHLSEQFGSFWLTGEVFELYRSPAGHSYFTLKDPNAAIKCVMFRQKIAVPLEKGMQVTLLGQMTLYTPKGDIQVNALKVMEAGQGDLAQQFLILKQKLMQAGLFDASNKKKIPDLIQSLGIITSAKGAALQDILNVLQRQNPLIDITIYPTLVQGNEAPPQINHALRQADEVGHDVLLLTRGGGSKEDLWAFNDEFLAHQLAQLETPVIAAIGHETDESIADLVADLCANRGVVLAPHDPQVWADSLGRVLDDRAHRTSLALRGLTAAADHTWEASAAALEHAWRRLLAGPGAGPPAGKPSGPGVGREG